MTQLQFSMEAPPKKFKEVKNDDDDDDDDDDGNWKTIKDIDVIQHNESDDEDEDDELDWIPDAELARIKKEYLNRQSNDFPYNIPDTPTPKKSAKETTAKKQQKAKKGEKEKKKKIKKKRPTPYTEEEEAIIEAMGGKFKVKRSKRLPGYLGDSTLEEIAMDYSVPMCYLADVLSMWGIPPPINVQSRLGDLVTGEQAFAILEAVYSLDMGAVNDRYGDQTLESLCADWEFDLTDAFNFAVKEGWSLPFGIHTVLRVEQERELLRVFSLRYDDPDD